MIIEEKKQHYLKEYEKEELLNDISFNTIVNRYKLKAMNVFKWLNLPKNVHSHDIEELLFEYGAVGFNYDKERGFIALQINAYNFLDINYRPIQASLIGMGFNKLINIYWGEDSLKTIIGEKPLIEKDNTGILIKNNDLYISTRDLLEYKLWQLYNVERKLDLEINLLPLQNVISGSTQDRASFRELFNNVRKNKLFNAINSSGMKEPPQAIDLKHNFNGIDLIEIKRNIESEIHTILGLNNVNFEKKERLLVDEVKANNETIENEISASLRTRKEACKLINEFYNLNISVELNMLKESEGVIRNEKENI